MRDDGWWTGVGAFPLGVVYSILSAEKQKATMGSEQDRDSDSDSDSDTSYRAATGRN